ncbi:MAG: hypothetical protein QXE79_02435 [Candidatus Bathyarchaeia archaeon]
MDTDAYPWRAWVKVQISDLTSRFKEQLKTALSDSIVKILLENSCLTEVQLETLLIDLYQKENGDEISQEMKLSLRKDVKVSRGAFNRTKRQAMRNIAKSIYTILLLGYLGLLETPQLEPFTELSSKLRTLRDTVITCGDDELARQLIGNLLAEIEEAAQK